MPRAPWEPAGTDRNARERDNLDRRDGPSGADACAASTRGDNLPPPLLRAYECTATRRPFFFHDCYFKGNGGKLSIHLPPLSKGFCSEQDPRLPPQSPPQPSAAEAGPVTSLRAEPTEPSRRRGEEAEDRPQGVLHQAASKGDSSDESTPKQDGQKRK